MKILIKEVIYPIKDFYAMRKRRKSELVIFCVLPLFIGALLFVIESFVNPMRRVDIDAFALDLLNQIITVLTLFISFSMAYLSIIVTSSSESVIRMKSKNSKYYFIAGKPCTLFQVLMSDLTYTLIIEILFLLFIFFQKFLIYMCNTIGLRILISMNVCLMVHVLILLMITVKNIYFSFWKG